METRLQRRQARARGYLTLDECIERYIPDGYNNNDLQRWVLHTHNKLHPEIRGLTKYPLYELRLLKQMDKRYKIMFKIQSKQVRELEIYIRIIMNRENESQTEYVLK